jgi:ABC-type sugar transport system permease subunit
MSITSGSPKEVQDSQEQNSITPVSQNTPKSVGGGGVASSVVPHSISAARRRWIEFGWAMLYLSPALAVFILFSYLPFFRAIWLSLHVTDVTGDTVRFNGINYYTRIFNLDGSGRDEYLKSIGISFQFALMVVPLGIVSGIALAVLAAVKVKGIGIFRTVFTSSIAVSVASAGVIWALIYNPSSGVTSWLIDLLDIKAVSLLNDPSTALIAVSVMTVWTTLGFNFIITLAGIQAIPQDLYESGLIDGANGWKAFRFITLPLLTPTLLFLFIISTISTFQAFTQFSVLINGEGPNGSTNVFIFAAFKNFWYDNRYGFASAMSIVLFLILLILTFIQFRLLDRRVHYQ